MNNIRYWLKPKAELFKDFSEFVLSPEDDFQHRVFIDRGSNILFVAHLDTVLPPKLFKRTVRRIYAQGLDDRLGCMTAYNLSEELGADLLLTDHEESGGTTAAYHDCKDYNWIVEFDRAGDDVVTYGIDCPAFKTKLLEYWKVGWGSYSDICELQTKACCMNLGIGVEFSHSPDSYMVKKTYRRQIKLFREFFEENKDIKFERDDNVYEYKHIYDYNAGECDACGCYTSVEEIYGYYLCEPCLDYMMCDYNIASA